MKNLTVSKSRHQPLHREGATVHEARSETLSPHEVAAEKSQRTSTRRKERQEKKRKKPEDTGIGCESSNCNANMLINLEHLLLIRRQLRGRTLLRQRERTVTF